MRVAKALGAAVLLVVVAAGCTDKKKEAQDAQGTRLAPGDATDLRLTPDDAHALYLLEGEKPRVQGVPAQMVIGELWTVPTDGTGGPRKVGNGVTNVPGGYVVSPDSRWVLYLEGYNAVAQTGTLHAFDLSGDFGEPKELGRDVSYMLASGDSKQVAFVAEGILYAGPLPQGPFRQVAGEVHTAGFTPDSQQLVYRRRLAAAGGFFIVPMDGSAEPVKLGEQVGDFELAPGSDRVAFTQRSRSMRGTWELYLASAPEWKAKKVAEGAGPFGFSRDGKYLARVQDGRPEEPGNLHVGPADGSAARKVGTKVNEFTFAPTGDAVAYLELYDISASAGVLGVASLPDGAPKRIGNRVPNYGWAPDGRSLAFISRFIKPMYTVDLMVFRLGDEEAKKVHQDVFAYGHDPKSRYVLYRSNCVRNARSCDLFQLDLSKVEAGGTRIVEGVYSFKLSKDGQSVLLTHPRLDSQLFDMAVYDVEKKQRKLLAQYIQLPAAFAANAERVVFVSARRNAAGIFAATELP